MNMQPEIANWAEALSMQLALFRELASELAASHKAYVAMDCEAIYRHAGAQAVLCARLREAGETCAQALQTVCACLGLPPSLDNPHRVASRLDVASGTGVKKLLAELVQAKREVRHLNEEQSVLISGSRRTLRILGNALARYSAIYKAPLDFLAFAANRIQQ